MKRWRTLPVLVFALTTGALASTGAGTLSCLSPVSGVTWLRWEQGQQRLDLWCQSVGPPVFTSAPERAGEISRLQVVSWNVHVGGADVEKLMAEGLGSSSGEEKGLVVLLQEAFRAGADVPESYPRELRVPSAIRPRRPTLDVVGLANRSGMSVAYVPSMRNGSATRLEEREDRGNAILSTEPLSDVRAIELPFGKQRRVAIAATVTPRGGALGPMRVITAHFDTSGVRVPQAEALGERIVTLGGMQMIVSGDFNARRGFKDGTVAAISRRVQLESCGTRRTNRWPLRLDVLLFFVVGRLDFMFSTFDSGVPRTCRTLSHAYDSDHLPVLLDLGVE
jgi:endonuclease/exonuclease/phosphatase family metal-dependent hydrolase